MNRGLQLATALALCGGTAPALLAATAPGKVILRESFEGGAGRWKPYHGEPPQATARVTAGDAADGQKLLRIECPGHRRLEGSRVAVDGIDAFSLYTLRARARGKGNLFVCLLSANGWVYARQDVALTGQWQDVSLAKLTGAGDRALSLYFLTRQREKATFEIDAVEVTKEPKPQAADATVEPVRFEAENYAPSLKWIVKEDGALAGKAVRTPIYAGITSVPFPLTSRPAFVWLRARPGTPTDVFELRARIGGYAHKLASARPAARPGWQWLRFEVPTPAAARGAVDVRVIQPERGLAPALLDALVVATKGELTATELEAAPRSGHGRPLVAAGRCKAPPTIDGRTDDACWADCVAVRDFTLTGRDAAPSQSTVARLCYDAERLYVAFRCREYVLQPEANQLHAFRQTATQRDARVWRDDSVVVIAAPDGKGPFIDVFCNARGTVEDARCTRPDLWGKRDTAWNGDIQAAGRVADGFWEVELGIALKSLGAAAPKPGDRWRLCLGRIEKNARETSTWNPVVRGFHEADSLGTLVFLPRVGGADARLPESLRGGGNAAMMQRAADARALLAEVTLEQLGRPAARSRAIVAAGAEAEVAFDVATEGKASLSCDLLDAASLAPLYLSPRLKRRVRASDATVRLATEAPWVLFLNGARVASGPRADGNRPITVPLHKGVNAFSFQVESGKLAAAIELPGQTIVSDGAWRFAPGEPARCAEATFNDSKWAHARILGDRAGDLGKQGARQVGGDGPGIVRRVVWFEKTYLWPTPDPAQHVPQNAAQHLTFSATGMRGRALSGFTLCLAVPPEFEVIGSSGYYGRARGEKAEFLASGPERLRRRGKDVLLYTVRATRPLPYRPKVRILELLNVFVRYRGPVRPAAEYTFEYWTEAEDGSITECPQTFPVRVTPALRGRQPKRLVLQLWGSFFGPMDDPAMKEATLDTMRAVGFNNLVSGNREDTELARKYGITNTMGINFEPWCLSRADYLKAHPDDALLDAKGQRSTKYVCTTALLGHGWDDVAQALRRRIEANRPHIVDWDYESSPFTSYLSCYCPRCMAAFREHAGIAADMALSPKSIRETHAAPWIDFLTTRNAQLARKFRDVANACGARFSMYSGYESEETHRVYGVDWRKIGRLGAADHVGCGYGRSKERIDASVAALGRIPLVVGVLMRPYDRSLRERVVPLTKARLLRRLADSTGGILVYDRLPLGGRSWLALAEVSRLAADHEALFLHGTAAPELATVEGAAEPDLAVKRLGKAALVLLMNASRKPRTMTVRFDAAVKSATRYYAAAAAKPADPLAVHLAPGEAEAIVLTLQ